MFQRILQWIRILLYLPDSVTRNYLQTRLWVQQWSLRKWIILHILIWFLHKYKNFFPKFELQKHIQQRIGSSFIRLIFFLIATRYASSLRSHIVGKISAPRLLNIYIRFLLVIRFKKIKLIDVNVKHKLVQCKTWPANLFWIPYRMVQKHVLRIFQSGIRY